MLNKQYIEPPSRSAPTVCPLAGTPLSPCYWSTTTSVTMCLLQDPGPPADVAPSRACPRLQDVPLQRGSCTICLRPTSPLAKPKARGGPGGHCPASQPRSSGAKASNGCPCGHRQPEFMFMKPRKPYLSCKSCKVLSGNLVLEDFPLFPQTPAGLRTKAGSKARQGQFPSPPGAVVGCSLPSLAPGTSPKYPPTGRSLSWVFSNYSTGHTSC